MSRVYQQWIIDLREQCEAKGFAEGFAKGRAKKAIEAAKNMLRDGVPVEKISSYLELPLEEIKSLQTELLATSK